MPKNALLLLVLIVFLISCSENNTTKLNAVQDDVKELSLADNEFNLVGSTFTNEISEVLLYHLRQDTLRFIDTIQVKNRLFTYKGISETPELFTIKTNATEEGFDFLVDNSQIDIALNTTLKQSSTFSNTKIQKAYNRYVQTIDSFANAKQSLLDKYPVLNAASVKKIQEDRLKISKDKSRFVADFIKSQSTTKLAALLINEYKTVLDINKIRSLYDGLTSEIKDLDYSTNLNFAITVIEEKFKTAIIETSSSSSTSEYRTKAFAISGPSPDGTLLSLNSIPQGKVILVDFWASWCGPCRVANPNIVRLYNTYKHRGFEILSVSEDRGESEWINAIANDNLLWPYHILDKNKSIAFRYGVESIPFNLLIDKQGRIASEKLSGSKLEHRIQQLLNE